MAASAVAQSPPLAIEKGKVYPLAEFVRIVHFGRHAMRAARNAACESAIPETVRLSPGTISLHTWTLSTGPTTRRTHREGPAVSLRERLRLVRRLERAARTEQQRDALRQLRRVLRRLGK